MHSVFTVDPGGRTGWSWCCIDLELAMSVAAIPITVASLGEDRFKSGEIGGSLVDQVGLLIHYFRESKRKTLRNEEDCIVRFSLVTEGFRLQILDSDPALLDPVRINFGLELAVHSGEIECDYFGEQTPADAKGVCSDKRMQRWGLWFPGEPHRMDAVRHLVLFLRKELTVYGGNSN